MERLNALIKRLSEQNENNVGNKSLLATASMIVAELQNKVIDSGNNAVSVILPNFRNDSELNEEIFIEKNIEEPIKTENQPAPYFFDPLKEFPTLALKQQEMRELNLAFENNNEANLNDKLNTGQKEIASKLIDTPVKDLRKAIGINDRYHFISELFRGDESMYERSIKTINSFNVYGEAELWISRELKTKLGWNDESTTVETFNQLVRRRFS